MNKLLLVVLMLANVSAMAAVKWTDENGAVHYSDKLPSGRQGQAVAYHETLEWKESGFASINDVSAVPGLNDKTRAGYTRFLDLRSPRTFLLCHDGSVSAISGGSIDFIRRETRKKMEEGCSLYAVDNRVVYRN
jgi:hypothetical protein